MQQINILRRLLEVTIKELCTISCPDDEASGSLTSRVVSKLFHEVQSHLGMPLPLMSWLADDNDIVRTFEVQLLIKMFRNALRPLSTTVTNVYFDPHDIASSADTNFWEYTPQQDKQVLSSIVSMLTVELINSRVTQTVWVFELQTKMKHLVDAVCCRDWLWMDLPSNPFDEANAHLLDTWRTGTPMNKMLTDMYRLLLNGLPKNLCDVQT